MRIPHCSEWLHWRCDLSLSAARERIRVAHALKINPHRSLIRYSSPREDWAAGGETNLDNLLLLCTRHHRLVHEGGFSITKDYLDRWYFKRPDGHAVPNCGYRLEDALDNDIDANGADLDMHPSAEGLPVLPLCVAEHSPPAYLAEISGCLH